MCGPPCETWSVARWNPRPDGRAPPPIRDAASSWGRPAVTAKQHRQLEIGNQLLLYTLRLAIASWVRHVDFVLEHPQFPAWSPHAHIVSSIWTLWQMRLIARLPRAELIDIVQGHYGQLSDKPTTFLTLNATTMRQYLDAHKRPTSHRVGLQMARTASGGFTTAALKTHLPALCAELAGGIADAVEANTHSAHEHASDVDDIVQRFMVPWDPYLGDGVAGHDCMIFR